MKRILLVDDDPVFRGRLAKALRRRDCEVVEVEGPEQALGAFRKDAFEGVVLDLRMPGGSGLDLLPQLKGPRVVVLTGYGSIPTALEAVRRGAVHVLQKPAGIAEILAALEGAPALRDEDATPTLDRVEWEHIQRVLTDTGGNVSEAARRLGLHRRSLQRKLERPAPKG